MLNDMVNSLPVIGPLVDAIVARRKSAKKGRKSRRPGVIAVVPRSRTGASRRRSGGGGSIKGNTSDRRVPNDRLMVNPIPVAINMGAGSTSWKINGKAQTLTEFSADRSIRLVGSSLFSSTVRTTVSGTSFLFGSTPYVNVGPFEIDPRMSALAAVFQYYAIRQVRFTFVPTNSSGTGSFTVSNVGNNTLAFGILDNVDLRTEVTTVSQILDMDPSMMIQSTGTQALYYSHNGTKVWAVDPTLTADDADKYQFSLFGLSQFGSGSAAQNYGSIYVNYVIDLYQPSFITSTVDAKAPCADDGKDCSVDSNVSSDVKDEKGLPNIPRSLSIPTLKRSVGFQADHAPPSPTKSLLAAELRDLRSKHFAKPVPTCATS